MKVRLKGGPGSGHRGHAGRPGLVGGSAPGVGDVRSIDVGFLTKYAEYIQPRSMTYPDLVRDIEKHGIKEPLILSISPDGKFALLTQGNHRLAAARELGINDVPVKLRVHYTVSRDINMHVKRLRKADLGKLIDVFGEDIVHGTVVEKQLPIADESMTALVKARINVFFDESDALATKMFTGKVSLGRWQEDMKQLIRECHTSTAAIGGGGWDEMTWAQWGRLGTPLRNQYRWLQGFTEFISENREDISLRAIQARARLYGEGAGGSTVLMQTGPVLERLLPWIPKDGSAECLNRCHCKWALDVTGKQPDGSQEVQAVWLLGVAEHCDTCVGRDGHMEMMVVPAGEMVPDNIGGI